MHHYELHPPLDRISPADQASMLEQSLHAILMKGTSRSSATC
jgi:hypothetical protein